MHSEILHRRFWKNLTFIHKSNYELIVVVISQNQLGSSKLLENNATAVKMFNNLNLAEGKHIAICYSILQGRCVQKKRYSMSLFRSSRILNALFSSLLLRSSPTFQYAISCRNKMTREESWLPAQLTISDWIRSYVLDPYLVEWLQKDLFLVNGQIQQIFH